ncbi:MAG: hypothetical protein JOZ72_08020 [Alphaproteobacteria bacterium]|nr:hypothetical protein [Alphaproteobacteria bacterium]
MKLLPAALVSVILAGVSPALASAQDDLVALLKQHMTEHGKQTLEHEGGLVGTGDVSISGLKDDLRGACRVTDACFRLRDLPDDDARTGMSLLAMDRARHLLDGRIGGMERDKDREAKDRDLQRMHERQGELQDAIKGMEDDVRRILDEIGNSQQLDNRKL